MLPVLCLVFHFHDTDLQVLQNAMPCKQADTVHGYQQWQDMLAPNMSTTDDAWHTDTFSC